jgi:hypothetical protein
MRERESVQEDIGYKPLERRVIFDPSEELDPGANEYLAHYPRRMSREQGMAEWRKQLKRAS